MPPPQSSKELAKIDNLYTKAQGSKELAKIDNLYTQQEKPRLNTLHQITIATKDEKDNPSHPFAVGGKKQKTKRRRSIKRRRKKRRKPTKRRRAGKSSRTR